MKDKSTTAGYDENDDDFVRVGPKQSCCSYLCLQRFAILMKLSVLACFWCTFFYSIALYSSYYKGNMSALKDSVRVWESRSWIDIVWAQDECPAGYEPFGNLWAGTEPGNYKKGDN